MHPNVSAVQAALAAGGAQGQVVMLPDAVTTAALAAAALGVEVGQIANSLIFRATYASETGDADPGPLLVLTSGAHRVDTVKVAALLGYASVKRATPEFVREHTGQPIGGVAPVGHPKPIPTLVDVFLGTFPVIWAAGGIPHAVFPTTFDELVRVTGGTPAEVA
jgi:prolyl-tRNA editing enzyme YbaK/EbsC (Cys-tRNA(Pro) deacylase)